jgi:hypothetical protein
VLAGKSKLNLFQAAVVEQASEWVSHTFSGDYLKKLKKFSLLLKYELRFVRTESLVLLFAWEIGFLVSS